MSTAGLGGLPTPQHVTVLFKMHKSTVLLSVQPEDNLDDVKTQLVAVLRTRGITTLPGTDTPLPQPSALEFGVLADRKDRSKGWISAETRANLPKKKKTKPDEGEVETIGELDLRDGMYIAYRLRPHTEIALDDDGDMQVDAHGWDVEFPSYDDEEEIEDAADNDVFGDDDIEIPKPRNAVSTSK